MADSRKRGVSADGSPRSLKRRQTITQIPVGSPSPETPTTRSTRGSKVKEPEVEQHQEASPLDATFFEEGAPVLHDFLNPTVVLLFTQVRVSLFDEYCVIDTGRRRVYDSEHHLLVLVFCSPEGLLRVSHSSSVQAFGCYQFLLHRIQWHWGEKNLPR
jgi:hypothetical protein